MCFSTKNRSNGWYEDPSGLHDFLFCFFFFQLHEATPAPGSAGLTLKVLLYCCILHVNLFILNLEEKNIKIKSKEATPEYVKKFTNTTIRFRERRKVAANFDSHAAILLGNLLWDYRFQFGVGCRLLPFNWRSLGVNDFFSGIIACFWNICNWMTLKNLENSER